MLLAVLAGTAWAADASLARFEAVDVAPVKTNIYVASVMLDVPQFVRRGALYESRYTAKVFPYFFWNEHGTLRIAVSDETLRRFAQGASFPFTGHAIRSDGTDRRVEGQVTPTDAATGTIEVRIHLTRHLSLHFDTTYRLPRVRPSEIR